MPNTARANHLPGSYEHAAIRFREEFGNETCKCPDDSCQTKVKDTKTIWLGDNKGNLFNPECVLKDPDGYPETWIPIAKEEH